MCPACSPEVVREPQRDGIVSGFVAAAVSAEHQCCPSIGRAATNPDTIHVVNFYIRIIVTLINATPRAREDSCAVMRDSFLRVIPVLCHLYFRRAGAMPRVVKLDDPVVLAMRQTNSERD